MNRRFEILVQVLILRRSDTSDRLRQIWLVNKDVRVLKFFGLIAALIASCVCLIARKRHLDHAFANICV